MFGKSTKDSNPMRRSHGSYRHLEIILCFLGLLLFTVQPANACSCGFYKVWGFLSPNGQVPLNSHGVMWWGEFTGTAKETAPVQITDDAGKVVPMVYEKYTPAQPSLALKSIWMFRPKDGFKAGKSYIFMTHQRMGNHKIEPPQRIRVTVSAAEVTKNTKPLTLKKGNQTAEMLTVLSRAGSCSSEVTANQLPIAMQLPPELQSFKEQFYYETLIDGVTKWGASRSLCSTVPPGTSWQGKAVDLLYSTCALSVEPGLGSEKHTVTMRASLPGTDIQFTTAPIEVDLPCPAHP